MALPTYVAAGAPSSGVAAITPALPAGIAANDILLMVVETRSNQAIGIANANGGTWTALGSQDVTGTTATRLTVFWSRYNGTQGDPTTTDSGDHQIAYIEAWRGCITTVDPFEGGVGGVDATSDTTLTATGSSTTGPDRIVIVAASRDNDAAGAHYSGWTNADLANIIERFDDGTIQGNGGGLGVISGEKATSGAYGNTTATLAAATSDAFMAFALIPAGGTPYTASLAGTLTPSGNLAKAVSKPLSGALTAAGNLAKTVGKQLAGTLTPVGALERLTSKALSGTLTTAGTLASVVQKLYTIALTGTLTPAGALAKTVGKQLAGTLTPAGALERLTSKALSGTLTTAGALRKTVGKLLSGTVAFAGTLVTAFSSGGTIMNPFDPPDPGGRAHSSPSANGFDPPDPRLGA